MNGTNAPLVTYECYELLLFKVIERLSRFYRHIKDVNEQHGKNYQAHTIELEYCLWIIYNKLLINFNAFQTQQTPVLFEELFDIYNFFKKFHSQLIHLPRPSRPVEIIRFCRMLQKGLEGESGSGIAIKMSVDIGELPSQEIYNKTPVELLKNELQTMFGTKETHELEDSLEKSSDCHLAIPRIEIKNPCVWATTAHEIAHEAMSRIYKSSSLLDNFYTFLGKMSLSKPDKFTDNEPMLESHLVEYWCDFFGSLAMGWGFWFAQLDSMMFVGLQKSSSSHPPSYLRLRAIKQILRSRLLYKNDTYLLEASNCESSLLEQIRTLSHADYDKDDFNLYQLFLQYAFDTLYRRKKNNSLEFQPEINSLINFFIKYSNNIQHTTITHLIKTLSEGYPVPSIRVDNEDICERATSVQEILLSAALAKNCHIKNSVIEKFNNICKDNKSIKDSINNFLIHIDPIFEEFDLCILRSIQVSEYVDLLVHGQTKRDDRLKQESESFIGNESSSLLIDKSIFKKIKNGELKIIPLIDLNQIGSTSLDIRLGTSFQLYYPNRSGVIDFTENQTLVEARNNSFLIDLDFMDSFVLAPGNFILGHTMEYLCLPPTIAAELEGRSSYARLGIEIHMTASYIDPGFHGVLTLEIYNAGPNPIKLFPGLRIGQLRFFDCQKPTKDYGRNPQAKYKGLLTPRGSLHSNDPEILIYINKIEKERKKT